MIRKPFDSNLNYLLYEDSGYDPYRLDKNVQKAQDSSWGDVELKDLLCENKDRDNIPHQSKFIKDNLNYVKSNYGKSMFSKNQKTKKPYIYDLLFKFLVADIAIAAIIESYFYLIG